MNNRISPCLWFDTQAEDAARLYVSLFPHSRVGAISHYSETGQELHGKPPGSVMTVAFELDGQPFTALNGGPQFRFSEAVSFQVSCETQQEVDHYWDGLCAGGGEPGPCGWLKDRFGVSWQIVPRVLPELLGGDDPAGVQRAMNALLQMKKLDIRTLQQAYAG